MLKNKIDDTKLAELIFYSTIFLITTHDQIIVSKNDVGILKKFVILINVF